MNETLLGNTLEIVDMLADLMTHLSETDIGNMIFNDFLNRYPNHKVTFGILVEIGEEED